VGRFRDFQYRLTNRNSLPRGQVVAAQIEINEELIAGQGPSTSVLCYKLDDTAVHYRDLHIGMGAPIFSAPASSLEPIISHQSIDEVEPGMFQLLPLVIFRPAHDHLHYAPIPR
jgi:hypothetical protein